MQNQLEGKSATRAAPIYERHRPIITGVIGPDKVEVRGGLSTSDRIIVNPPAGLAEGDRVRE